MEITYDGRVDAMYIKFQNGKFKRTLKLKHGIHMDLSQDDKILGIEILDASEKISLKNIGHIGIDLPVAKVG